jgi:DNA-binding NarL/FixJ family response regulator
VRLAGAAAALRSQAGTRLPPAGQHDFEQRLAAAWSALRHDQAARIYANGERLSLTDAVTYGLAEDKVQQSRAAIHGTDEIEPGAEITRREWTIAELLAQGLTNRAIADRLMIGKRTVDTHIEHLMNKLVVHSRAQIAAWVRDRQLMTRGLARN